MKSLRRLAVYQGVTYPEYEIDFYTSDVYGKKFKNKNRALKPSRARDGYLLFCFIGPKKGFRTSTSQHGLLAETFYDLLPKSPLVSYYGLQIAFQDRHELKTPTGFTFICNMVCPDHIDSNTANNSYKNLMIVTQSENLIKCGPRNIKYKGVYKRLNVGLNTFQVIICFKNILDKNGKCFYMTKNFKTEEEAASAYNTMLEEAMLTIWGPELGLKVYDLAHKNVIKAPIQEQLILR